MKKLLRVSTKTGMWGNAGYWFTFADLEPQEVDFEQLSDIERETFNLAIRNKELEEFDSNGKKVKVKNPSVAKPVQPQTKAIHAVPMLEKRLMNILKGGVNSVRREVDLMKSVHMLGVLLQLEEEGKKRKTVVALIKKKIGKLGSVVQNGKTMYDYLIEESDEEVIKIQPEDIVVRSVTREVYAESEEDLRKQVEKL